MKTVARLLAVAVLFVSAAAMAANFDGSYKFSSRTKEGAPEMTGWQGQMTIKGDVIDRTYKSPDGKENKFYTSAMKQDGNIYVLKHTKAYKPEYVGNEHRSRLVMIGNLLTLESEDGKFKEVWQRQ